MKGTSKVIMGATLVMVVSLAMVLALILILLAELYCSLLLRRRYHQHKDKANSSIVNTDIPTATVSTEDAASERSSQPQGPPLGSFLGVLRAPRSLLFEEYNNAELKKQQQQRHHHVLDIGAEENSKETPAISLVHSPHPNQEDSNAVSKDHLVYISNPIFDNEANRDSSTTAANTPFETPDTSPSRLEIGGSSSSSSGEDNNAEVVQPTPPLTPMKKLPKEACSVSLRDARSLGTSGSDSNGKSSSSVSGSPCTSPSW